MLTLISFQDATANDIPSDTFEVQGFPTLYFRSSSGNLVQYDGGRSKEEIIDFIEKNRDKTVQDETKKQEDAKTQEEDKTVQDETKKQKDAKTQEEDKKDEL